MIPSDLRFRIVGFFMSNLTKIIKDKVSADNQENINLGKQKCNEAKALLEQARKTGKNQAELAKKAITIYYEAISLNSKLIEPYLGIAYVAYSAGDSKTALGLLNQALYLEPDNKYANEMLKDIQDDIRHKAFDKITGNDKGNSITEKIKFSKKSEKSIMEKITSIFFTSTKKEKAKKDTVTVKTPVPVANTPKPKSDSNDFASFLKETSKIMNKTNNIN